MSPIGTPEHLWMAADLHDALQPLRRERGWRGSPQGPPVCIEGPRNSLVPDYVLVPPGCPRWGQAELPTVTVHSDIADGAYRSIATVPMGKPLHLPAPVDVELDTSIFMA
ncbi:hypothetical protein [Nonomuraea sp. NPDC050783]|uniref:hypothetical protein n=1 Tax=Nonomuraea sp. NPDC050783 TaxID=3154634 RepID=UPI003467CD3E